MSRHAQVVIGSKEAFIDVGDINVPKYCTMVDIVQIGPQSSWNAEDFSMARLSQADC